VRIIGRYRPPFLIQIDALYVLSLTQIAAEGDECSSHLEGEFAVRAVPVAWTVKDSKGELLAPLHCPLAAGGRPGPTTRSRAFCLPNNRAPVGFTNVGENQMIGLPQRLHVRLLE